MPLVRILFHQLQREVIQSAIDLEKACPCQLAADTAGDSAAVAEKKGWTSIDKGAAVMWALVALMIFVFNISFFYYISGK